MAKYGFTNIVIEFKKGSGVSHNSVKIQERFNIMFEVLKKIKKLFVVLFFFLFLSGGRIRTYMLQIMSLTRQPFSHPRYFVSEKKSQSNRRFPYGYLVTTSLRSLNIFWYILYNTIKNLCYFYKQEKFFSNIIY